jgi:hypothetical protein
MLIEDAGHGTVALFVTFALALAALGAHAWRSVTSGHQNLVLRAVPLALAPLALPLPFAIWSIIAAFAGIAKTGSSGLLPVAAVLRGFLQVQWLGVVAAGAIVMIAAVIERLGAAHIERATPSPEPAASRWRSVILVGAAALLLPVVAVSAFVHQIPHVIMEIGHRLTPPATAAPPLGDASGVAQRLSARIVLGVVCSMVVAVAVLLGVAGTFVASSAARPSRPLVVAGWIAAALALAAIIGGVVGYAADMRWLNVLTKGSTG